MSDMSYSLVTSGARIWFKSIFTGNTSLLERPWKRQWDDTKKGFCYIYIYTYVPFHVVSIITLGPKWFHNAAPVFFSCSGGQKHHKQRNQKSSLSLPKKTSKSQVKDLKTLGCGFKDFFMFTPNLGEDEPILTSIFFRWVGSTTN